VLLELPSPVPKSEGPGAPSSSVEKGARPGARAKPPESHPAGAKAQLYFQRLAA